MEEEEENLPLSFPLRPRDIIFNALPLCARTGKWEMGKEGIMGGV